GQELAAGASATGARHTTAPVHATPTIGLHAGCYTAPRARGGMEVGMSVYKHVLVALGLIAACGPIHAGEPVPTAAAATAMFYAIELDDTKVAELADIAPVAASTLLMFRAQPTIDPVDMRRNVSYFSAKPNARSVRALLDGDENG